MAAAAELFTERGFDNTTADEIAEAAKCSRSTLFRYFRTKEDILFGDDYSEIAAVRAALAALPPCDDPWQAAKDIALTRFLAFLSGETGPPRECIELWFSHPTLLSRYQDNNHRWEELLEEFFAAQRGVRPETDLLSQLQACAVVSAIRAAMRAYSVPGTDLRAATQEAFELLENGFARGRASR
jgi:AcrR family transcriptional regulator